MSKKVITLQNDIEAEGVSAEAGDKVLLKNLLNKDSLREEIDSIVNDDTLTKGERLDLLLRKLEYGEPYSPSHSNARFVLEYLLTSHIEEAERKAVKNELDYIYENMPKPDTFPSVNMMAHHAQHQFEKKELHKMGIEEGKEFGYIEHVQDMLQFIMERKAQLKSKQENT